MPDPIDAIWTSAKEGDITWDEARDLDAAIRATRAPIPLDAARFTVQTRRIARALVAGHVTRAEYDARVMQLAFRATPPARSPARP